MISVIGKPVPKKTAIAEIREKLLEYPAKKYKAVSNENILR
jgi:hypothetical protein